MSQATQPATVCRSVALVAHASGDFVNLWAGEDEMYVAVEDDELGRWAIEAVLDEKHEAVPMGAPDGNRWMRFASRLADAYLPALDDPNAPEVVAVHLVCRVQRRELDGSIVAVVWPPRGAPRNARNEAELGRIIREVASDDSQPKVPAGPPPDAGGELLDRVSRGIAAAARSDGG